MVKTEEYEEHSSNSKQPIDILTANLTIHFEYPDHPYYQPGHPYAHPTNHIDYPDNYSNHSGPYKILQGRTFLSR